MNQSNRSIRRRLLTFAAVALVSLTASACGSEQASSLAAPADQAPPGPVQTLDAATLRAGQAVPAPTTTPVLTLTGTITNRNAKNGLRLDPALLDQMGVVRVEIYDPWTKARLPFRGVGLADLLNVAGAAPKATKVHLTALDDYEVDLTMDQVQAGGIFLATRNGDGSDIRVDKGGPTRIVFLDDVPSGENPDQWIWSLATIEVR